jgi:hypothetical protein
MVLEMRAAKRRAGLADRPYGSLQGLAADAPVGKLLIERGLGGDQPFASGTVSALIAATSDCMTVR